jgi:transaldolase
MLGGGARSMRHFTDFVGSEMHITINWSTAEEIMAANPPIEHRMGNPPAQRVIDELLEKLPDFGKAWDPQGLSEDEFAHYGPVLHFRDKFIAGWEELLGTIRARRTGN